MSDTSIQFKDEGYTSPEFITNVLQTLLSSSENHFTQALTSPHSTPIQHWINHRHQNKIISPLLPPKIINITVHSNSKIIAMFPNSIVHIRWSMMIRFPIKNLRFFSNHSCIIQWVRSNWIKCGKVWRQQWKTHLNLINLLIMYELSDKCRKIIENKMNKLKFKCLR